MLVLNSNRRLAAGICLCLATASIMPAVAVACEGGELTGEAMKGLVKLDFGYKNIIKYDKLPGGPAETAEMQVKIEGEFKRSATDTCEKAKLKDKGTCTLRLECPIDGRTGKVAVNVPTELSIKPFEESLECVA